MAILGFPSTAIIGNLDWTGTSSNLSASQQVIVSAPSVDGSLGLNLGNGVAELYVDDGASYVRVYSDGEGVQIGGAGFVNVNAPFFWYKGTNVATQPFATAMAIALG